MGTNERAGAGQTATGPEVAEAVCPAISVNPEGNSTQSSVTVHTAVACSVEPTLPATLDAEVLDENGGLKPSGSYDHAEDTSDAPAVGSDPHDDEATPVNEPVGVSREIRRGTTGHIASVLRSGDLGWVAWDAFNDTITFTKGEIPTVLEEDGITRLIEEFELVSGASVRRPEFKNALHMVAKENAFDSAMEYVMLGDPWDGVQRVERFLPDYLGTPPTPYAYAVGRYLWTAMVTRIMEPGCKADMVPVLVGRQGVGKTSVLASIAPTPDHCGEARLTDRSSDLSRKVLGKTLVVWEELRGIAGRGDADEVKTFITSPYVEVRSRIRAGMDRHLRRFIIVGTSNRRDFLRDATGHRRYLPLDVRWVDHDRVAADKDQLWAEALQMVMQRRAAGLSLIDYQDAERLAGDEYQKYLNQARWVDDDVLLDWLKAGHDQFRTQDALEVVLGRNGTIGRRDRLDMADTLRQLGLKSKPTYIGDPNRRPDRWHQPKGCSQPKAPTP